MWWIWNLEKGVDKKIVNNKESDRYVFMVDLLIS